MKIMKSKQRLKFQAHIKNENRCKMKKTRKNAPCPYAPSRPKGRKYDETDWYMSCTDLRAPPTDDRKTTFVVFKSCTPCTCNT